MGNFLTSSSIGRKLVMSISGAFLVAFLIFHMAMNVVAIFSEAGYDMVVAFLGANWYALGGTAVLALGVAVHILYALWLTWQNRRARGKQRYAVTVKEQGVSWSSKNMLLLGVVIAIGLLLHLYHFWFNMQLQEVLGNHHTVIDPNLSPLDGAALIRLYFSQPVYVIIYLVWFVAIWFHLTHGLWSMMQTVGWANKKWYPRLKTISNVVATLVMLGFAAIVVFFYLKSLGVFCSLCL